MAAIRVLIALTMLLAFLAGRETTTVSRGDELTVEIEELVNHPSIDIFGSHPRIDIYGNRVDPAVGEYRVDFRGDLYERHAPDTAVLKLGPPST
jgi:hypothetical protein